MNLKAIGYRALRLTQFRYHQRITACADIATSPRNVRFAPESGHL